MNFSAMLRRLREFFHPKPDLSNDHIQRLIFWLENAEQPSMTCEEVYSLLDEYVEHEIHGENATRLMPLLERHLEICEECCEEYEALLDAVTATAGQNGSSTT